MTPEETRRLHNARVLYQSARHIMPPPEELPDGWDVPGDWSSVCKAFWLYDWRVKNGSLPEGETPEERLALAGFTAETYSPKRGEPCR